MKFHSPRQVFEMSAAPMRSAQHGAPRVVFVYAHPDDEMIAVGGHLPLFGHALFLQATDGAPADNNDGNRLGLSRDDYRATRALELRAAFAAAGLPQARHRCLNFADKEAALHLPELTRAVADVLRHEQPDVIFTHPYEGGHADHDACAFAVHIAVRMLIEQEQLPAFDPLLIESPFYFAAQDGSMQTGHFLGEIHSPNERPQATDLHAGSAVLDLPLSPEQQQRKRDAFDSFPTQAEVLAAFTPVLQHEPFRIAPAYSFTQPACTGRAFYQNFITGMTPAHFASLAGQAQRELMPEPVAA